MPVVQETEVRVYRSYKHPLFVPKCPIHGTEMVIYSRNSSICYFTCSVDKCSKTDKSPRVSFTPNIT